MGGSNDLMRMDNISIVMNDEGNYAVLLSDETVLGRIQWSGEGWSLFLNEGYGLPPLVLDWLSMRMRFFEDPTEVVENLEESA